MNKSWSDEFWRHFNKDIEVVLFWLGGFVTFSWVVIMGCVAHGLVDAGRDPGPWECVFYVGVVGFLLGVKGTRKRFNGGEIDKDRVFGELWAVVLILNAFFILFEYYTPWHIMEVKKIPRELLPSAIGVMGLFGAIKLLEIPEIIKKIYSRLLKP